MRVAAPPQAKGISYVNDGIPRYINAYIVTMHQDHASDWVSQVINTGPISVWYSLRSFALSSFAKITSSTCRSSVQSELTKISTTMIECGEHVSDIHTIVNHEAMH